MRNAKKSKSCPNVKYTKLMQGKKNLFDLDARNSFF